MEKIKGIIKENAIIAGKFLSELDYFYLAIPMCIALMYWIFGAYTGNWPWFGNAYNSFALQAEAWLNGQLDLGQDYTWLELAIFNGKYYVSFPPFPSYVLLPFAFFKGHDTPDHYICFVVAVIGAIYAYKLCKKFISDNDRGYAFILAMMIYIGSNTLWFILNGWVWFMAQSMSFTLTIMAVYYANEAKPGWSFLFWACAVGCRPFQILYLPVLIILMIRTWQMKEEDFSVLKKIKTQWFKGIPCLLVACSYAVLNYMRFGSIAEFGHNYLPEFTRAEHGQFSFEYLKNNIKLIFRLPQFMPDNNKFTFFTSDGIAFYLVNPIFIVFIIVLIYRIIKKRDEKLLIGLLILLLAALHIVVLCMHRTLGGWHFGNRYTCDTLPIVLFGTVLLMPESRKFKPVVYFAFIFGVVFNLIGTIATYNYWI